MALIQTKVAVKSNNGYCNSDCDECSSARGLVAKELTVLGDGILIGAIVPREVDNVSKWLEGCQCYVNFEYDDDQLVADTSLTPDDICLVCGCVVDMLDNLVAVVAAPALVTVVDNGNGTATLFQNGVELVTVITQVFP